MPKHPLITGFDSSLLRQDICAANGWRMPAEWEPLDAMWVVPPHNTETWPDCMAQAQAQHAHWRKLMAPYVKVRTARQEGIDTFDSWIRDFGPLYMVHPEKGLAIHDFYFNAWGNKYEGERELDNVVPQHIAMLDRTPVQLHNFVLEGGSIEVNGKGLLLSTEQCLFSSSRNPWMSREHIEQYLCESLGIDKILWLPGGIAGDDTDGHIDDIARFVAVDRIVCASAPEGHPDDQVCQRNMAALSTMRDVLGGKLDIIALPVPDPLVWEFPASHHEGGGKQMVPASYANFVMANGAMFVPVFEQKSDDIALRILEQASGHTVIPVPADKLIVGLGALHCLSMQQPRA